MRELYPRSLRIGDIARSFFQKQRDAEARALLLSIDPLADLTLVQDQLHPASADLQSLWQEAAQTIDAALEKKSRKLAEKAFEPQFLVLISCRDEAHQTELLKRFQ